MVEKKKETMSMSCNGEFEAWSTLEELLLVSAVNRHGCHCWDSISSEMLQRCRLNHPNDSEDNSKHAFSANNCRRKYVALKRRFYAADIGGEPAEEAEEEKDEVLRMVEELRKMRVEELKREVLKHDVSIMSLQMKLKELEDDKENNIVSKPDKQRPDLMLEPDQNTCFQQKPARQFGMDLAEVRSVNESNSDMKREPDEERAEPDQQPSRLGEGGNTGNNGINNDNNHGNSNNSKSNVKMKKNTMKEQSSDVQSSASLSGKKRRRSTRKRRGMINSSADELEAEEVTPANKKISIKDQPLIHFLDYLRSHKHGFVFFRRLPSQETEKYRNLIRQYMDLDTVQHRLERGIYSECHPKFYQDLLLIFTNGILFYRKSTAEHNAARELRKLVLEEVPLRFPKPETQIVKPDPEPHYIEPIVKKPRSSTTMVVCRRRNTRSIQGLSESMKKNEDLHNVKIGGVKHDGSTKAINGREEKSNANAHYPKKVENGRKKIIEFASKKKEGDKGVGVSNPKKLLSRERSSLGGGAAQLSNNNSKKIISKEGNNKKDEMGSNGNKVEGKTERSKMIIDQKQEKGTPILKKPGVAKFLKRIKHNSPSSQEKKAMKEEEEDVDEMEEIRREKINGASNNGNRRGGSGAKRNHVSNKDVEASVTRTSGRRGEKEAAASGRSNGRPPKRKAAMMSGYTLDSVKGGRSGGEKSKKRTRR